MYDVWSRDVVGVVCGDFDVESGLSEKRPILVQKSHMLTKELMPIFIYLTIFSCTTMLTSFLFWLTSYKFTK